MIKSFKKYKSEYVYPESFLLDNHKDKEYADLWHDAVKIATKNGTKLASHRTAKAIYNNLEKKRIAEEKEQKSHTIINKKERIVTNYNHWKSLYDLKSKLSTPTRDFYTSILNQLKKRGSVTYNQYLCLKKLE